MKVDKSINIHEEPLTFEERKEFKTQNVLFMSGIGVVSLLSTILILMLVYSALWRAILGTLVLLLIIVFASSVYSNMKDLKYGQKTIKKGTIWDIFELFTIESKKKDSDIARREFYLQVGDIEHRFAKVSFEVSSPSEEQEVATAKEFKVGQHVELHYSHSGYLLKEEKGELPSTLTETRIEAKIKSERRLTQFSPRKWDQKSKGTFYYFVVNNTLFRVDEEEFSRFRTTNLAKVSSNITDSSSVALSVKDDKDDWIVISAQV